MQQLLQGGRTGECAAGEQHSDVMLRGMSTRHVPSLHQSQLLRQPGAYTLYTLPACSSQNTSAEGHTTGVSLAQLTGVRSCGQRCRQASTSMQISADRYSCSSGKGPMPLYALHHLSCQALTQQVEWPSSCAHLHVAEPVKVQ